MQIDEQTLEKLIKETVKTTIEELGIGKQPLKEERNSYQKTELLLWNYRGFQRVIKEKQEQIEQIKKYGVPHKGSAVHTYCGDNTVHGISTVDETGDDAVHTVQRSVQELMQVIHMIETGLSGMKNDPYYSILEMRYFDGLGQEDMAKVLNCTQQNISYHKNRLVRELSLRLFPNEVAKELLQ